MGIVSEWDNLGTQEEIKEAKDIYHRLAGHQVSHIVLAPMWSITDSKWNWAGTEDELRTLMLEMHLVSARGRRIKTFSDVGLHLRDYNDPIFKHENVRLHFLVWPDEMVNLDTDNPIEKFVYLCLKACPTSSFLKGVVPRIVGLPNH